MCDCRPSWLDHRTEAQCPVQQNTVSKVTSTSFLMVESCRWTGCSFLCLIVALEPQLRKPVQCHLIAHDVSQGLQYLLRN